MVSRRCKNQKILYTRNITNDPNFYKIYFEKMNSRFGKMCNNFYSNIRYLTINLGFLGTSLIKDFLHEQVISICGQIQSDRNNVFNLTIFFVCFANYRCTRKQHVIHIFARQKINMLHTSCNSASMEMLKKEMLHQRQQKIGNISNQKL